MATTRKVVIIGSGPAGYTAAIYAARANLAPLMFTGVQSGGQLMLTTHVENFPGFVDGVLGPDLMETMRKQAERFGTDMIAEDVTGVDFSRRPFVVRAESGTYEADTVVIAVGYSGYFIPEKQQAKHVTITPNCAYPTRTITMTFGQRLEISNQSKFPFAPMIESEVSPAVMMAAPLEMGDPIRLYPRRPGHSAMGDIMQPYVRQDLYVLRYPLHAVSDLNGHYRIDGVPVGKLAIRALHPTVSSEAQAPVDIATNVVAKVDLTLEYAPKAPKVDDTKRTNNIFR